MFYNWDIIGHEKVLGMLEEDITHGNIPHAYLFVGPEKVGKYRVAKSIAGILQCEQNFCHQCPACIQIEKKCHLDTIELEDDGESIGIDAIREIIARLNMTGQSRYKMLLIQNINRLTDEASNSILKTLEEPSGKTLFIFTAGQVREAAPTIVSRMRIVHFTKLPDSVLRKALKDRFPDIQDETLDQVLLLSLGRSGKAIQLLTSPEIFQELLETYRQIQFIVEKASLATRFTTVQEISKDPQKMKTFLSLLVYYYRQKLLDGGAYGQKMAAASVLQEIHRVIHLTTRNVNSRLLLENLMLSL